MPARAPAINLRVASASAGRSRVRHGVQRGVPHLNVYRATRGTDGVLTVRHEV
jgi:hypothetical protein